MAAVLRLRLRMTMRLLLLLKKRYDRFTRLLRLFHPKTMTSRFQQHQLGAGDTLCKNARILPGDERIVFPSDNKGWTRDLRKTIESIVCIGRFHTVSECDRIDRALTARFNHRRNNLRVF